MMSQRNSAAQFTSATPPSAARSGARVRREASADLPFGLSLGSSGPATTLRDKEPFGEMQRLNKKASRESFVMPA
jgi:hypothetical protein